MSLYTAVTIGPISDTLGLTSSPAGLWGASYLFSWFSRTMIQNIVDKGIGQERFVSPFFTLSEEGKVTLPADDVNCEDMWQKGVGLFHDRIVFCSDGIEDSLAMVRDARDASIKTLSRSLSAKDQLDCDACAIEQWLGNYLRVYAVQGETTSPLLDLGEQLGALELEPRFACKDDENLLLRLLEDGSREGAHNARVKRFLETYRDQSRWILNGRKGAVRDLKDIAANGAPWSGMKYERYYAILNSDGDGMGAVLKTLDSDDEIRAYSRKCLLFCAKAARRMQEYGGVPLYAGGDDLLAILPMRGNDECTIFGLVNALREVFNKTFEDERERLGGRPSISFGISIQYYKSPLYEALEQARKLLWEAKGGLKNACCLSLQKHSGQSVRFVEERMDHAGEQGNLYAALDDLLRRTNEEQPQYDRAAKFLSGAGNTIESFRPLFCQAIEAPSSGQAVANLYDNLFDNAAQRDFEEYLGGLRSLTTQLVQKGQDDADEWQSRGNDQRAEAAASAGLTMDRLQSAVRLLHFMREKGDEEA